MKGALAVLVVSVLLSSQAALADSTATDPVPATSAETTAVQPASANVAAVSTSAVVHQTLTPVASTPVEQAPEPAASSVMLKGGTTDGSKYEDALAIECPQPALPTEHQEQGIKTRCVARFVIDDQGNHQVTLLTSTGSEEADEMAIDTLRKWKFKPAMLDGKAVKSTRKIRIEFEIE